MPKSYVIQLWHGYAFVLAIPKPLRGKFRSRTGKPLARITEGLATDSRKDAEGKALKRLTHWRTVFERAKHDAPLALAEIEDAARELYQSALARMATEAELRPDPEEGDWLAHDLSLTEQAAHSGDVRPVRHDIESVERRNGVSLDPASPTYATLAAALLRAKIAALTGRLALLSGKPSKAPASFLGSQGIDAKTLQPIKLQRPVARLKSEHGPWALFEQWIAEAKPAASTVNRWRAVFLDLQSRFKNRDVSEDDAREWARDLVTQKRSAATVSDVWLSAARTIYAWASEQKLASGNPFVGVKITVPKKIETRESKAFTDEEAKTILRAALVIEPEGNAFKAAQRWVPWLQAYSGARAGEITQLRGQDVVKQDGIWCVRLTPEAGTVKTKKPRLVPLHEHLIAMGFLNFVGLNGNGPLFATLKTPRRTGEATNPSRPRADKTRERLAGWVRELGISDKAVSPTHGWRHLFKQIAEGAGISERMSDYITGHAPATVGRAYGAPKVTDIATALAKFPRYAV